MQHWVTDSKHGFINNHWQEHQLLPVIILYEGSSDMKWFWGVIGTNL